MRALFNHEVEGLSLRNPEPQRPPQLDFTQVGKKMKIGYCLRFAARMVVNMLEKIGVMEKIGVRSTRAVAQKAQFKNI